MLVLLFSQLVLTGAQPTFSAKDQIHDAAPALPYVIIHPDCSAALYNLENASFSYGFHSHDITNVACNDPIGHDKAVLNVTGLPESCTSIQAAVEKKAALYKTGMDAGEVFDPHGTGKGYVTPAQKGSDNLVYFRLAGVGGKGLKFYQDTVTFKFDAKADGTCSLTASSQSQVSAGGDGGTNLCNIFNLINDVAKKYGKEDLGTGKNLVSQCCTSPVQCFSTVDSTLVV